jgi:hypothetical protein
MAAIRSWRDLSELQVACKHGIVAMCVDPERIGEQPHDGNFDKSLVEVTDMGALVSGWT